MAFKLAEAFVELSSRGFGKVSSDIKGVTSRFSTMGSIAASATKTAARGVAGFAAAAGAGSIGAIKLAANAEDTAISFEVMLGSVEKAETVIQKLTKLAASTPLQQGEINAAARSLVAFQVSSEKLIPTLKAIGDISSGIQAPIGQIAEIYGKAKVQGRLFMEDINQLTGRGIPIIGELAKQFGVAESEVRELVSSGQVNFGNLETAFQSLTSEGGIFFNMMDRRSQTLNGKWSTLMDSLKNEAKGFGKSLTEALDLHERTQSAIDGMAQFSFAIENAGTLSQIAAEHGKIAFANLSETIKTWGVNSIEIAGWFSQNWRDIMETTGNFSTTVFKNLAQNYMAHMQRAQNSTAAMIIKAQGAISGASKESIQDQLATLNEMQKPVKFNGLLDGFESTIKEMPKLTEATLIETTDKLEKLNLELAKADQKDREKRNTDLGSDLQKEISKKPVQPAIDLSKLSGSVGNLISNYFGAVNQGIEETEKSVQKANASFFSLSSLADRNQLAILNQEKPELSPGQKLASKIGGTAGQAAAGLALPPGLGGGLSSATNIAAQIASHLTSSSKNVPEPRTAKQMLNELSKMVEMMSKQGIKVQDQTAKAG